MESLELIIALCAGLGLSASCGFRIFIPPLVLSVAAHQGHISLSDEFAWMASLPAVIALGCATVLEVGAYYVPWLDNLLDSISTPAATIAGMGVAAASFGNVDPMLKWSLALIAGGGGAGAIQLGTVALRATSSVTTGGLGNPLISTGEGAAATGFSLMAILLPILAALVLIAMVFVAIRMYRRRPQASDEGPPIPNPPS